MLGLRARIEADLGAYLHNATPLPPHTAGTLVTGCYRLQNVELESRGRRTNKVPTGPYRGAGRPEAACFIESIVDDAAASSAWTPSSSAAST